MSGRNQRISEAEKMFREGQKYGNKAFIYVTDSNRRVREVIVCPANAFDSYKDWASAIGNAKRSLKERYPIWSDNVSYGGGADNTPKSFFAAWADELIFEPNEPVKGEKGPPIIKYWSQNESP